MKICQRIVETASCVVLNDAVGHRIRWEDAGQCADILQQLAERGIDFAPALTRRQRGDRVKRQQAAFFRYYQPGAKEILRGLVEKYASGGELQFTPPAVLKVPPISHRGNANEIIGKFGGADQLHTAANQLQSLPYVA